jgi:hypothetical protein
MKTAVLPPTSCHIPGKPTVSGKIPQPPNVFILFTKEWRSKLANQYINENNNQISIGALSAHPQERKVT